MTKTPRTMTVAGRGPFDTAIVRHDNGTPNPPYSSSGRSYAGSYVGYYEKLAGMVGNGWHPVTHVKVQCQRYDTSVPGYVEASDGTYYMHFLCRPESWCGYDASGLEAYPVSSGLVQDLSSMALNAMMPHARSEVSLLNTLYELKDVVTLKRSVGRVLDFGRSLRDVLSLSHKPYWAMVSFAKLGQMLADIKLQQSFNVSPLLRDIRSTCSSITGIKKYVNGLLDREGKPQKHHFRRDVTDRFPELNSSDARSLIGGGTYQFKERSADPWINIDFITLCAGYHGNPGRKMTKVGHAVFTATLEFSYSLSTFEREHALVLALMDKLGVNLNPSIIWNALPWTFVVDWFVGISQYLDGMKMRMLEPRVVISRYCQSLKVEYTESVSATAGPTTHFPYVEVPVSSLKFKSYSRTVGDPGIGHWLRTSGMNSDEFVLALSLAITRGKVVT